MRGRTTVVSGERLVVFGEAGPGAAVVFVHGNSLSWSSFDAALVAGLPRPWRAVGVDLPGHGVAPPAHHAERTYRLSGYAPLLAGAVSGLGLDRVVLCGHSLGGHVCLAAAGGLAGLAGVVVVGTPPLRRPPQLQEAFLAHPALHQLFEERLEPAGVEELAAAMRRPGAGADPRLTAGLRAADGRARSNLARSVAAGDVNDEVAIIDGLGRPVALVIGEHDQLVSRPYLERLGLRNLWRGSVQVVPGAGHVPALEAPAAFLALLSDFLRDLDG